MSILHELAAHAKNRVREAKARLPLEVLQHRTSELPVLSFPFERALQKPGLGFICECKKASPSKGVIAPDFPYLDIAKSYEEAGADCISVLTEPKWFLGQDAYLSEIASNVSLPCLRKDFTVDEYMIYEARMLGASAVLLIVSILEDRQLMDYLGICEKLGMSALVETHNAEEIRRAVGVGARVIGVNNRDLRDFSVDMENSLRLREIVPEEVLFVSESGIQTPEDVKRAREAEADAVLVGEAMMRAPDKRAKLLELKGV